MKKVCGGCGYKTGEKDMKCPICGGMLFTAGGDDDLCDPRAEAQWNGGYHNDFEEGRKTGEYCDPALEKYANGGAHYHGTERTSANQKTIFSDDTGAPPQAAIIFSIIISIFMPVIGPLIIIKLTKESDSEAARFARRAAIAVLVITVMIFAFSFFTGLSEVFQDQEIFSSL